MQAIDINSIMRQFDQYVQVSLQKKQSNEQPEPLSNQLDLYYQNMQKRLKIKTVTQDQKFQNMLGPMKKLKSFVSIKEFLRGLNQKPLKQQNQSNVAISQNTKRKLQYEDLRGGLYMEKVQNHLRRNHLKRKLDDQAEQLLKDLEQNQSEKNQYRTWMENVLGKINMKQETFLRPSLAADYEEKQPTQNNFIFADLTNKDNTKNTKRDIYKRRVSEQQQQKNFKKVSNFLAERLRKILTDKYVNNSSKQTKKNKQLLSEFNYDESVRMSTQPQSSGITYRKNICRTTATSKRMRQSVRNVNMRAQTSQLKNRRPTDDVWKKKLNSKMDGIMSVANNCYKRGQQDKKEYRNIINPFCVLVQDEDLASS